MSYDGGEAAGMATGVDSKAGWNGGTRTEAVTQLEEERRDGGLGISGFGSEYLMRSRGGDEEDGDDGS
ncbi:hypothetical protein AHAS_Ahas15G0202600 [Arachis hypogaea]